MLGENANELQISLLERLHNLYDKAKLPRFVTLLTNYRCHNGILMLPSSLYYQSTLECRVPDDTAHNLAPFPLIFVCSDITQHNEKTSGINEVEADALIAEVRRYFSKWPTHWDKGDRICVMSSSADQVTIYILADTCGKIKIHSSFILRPAHIVVVTV